MPAIPATPIDSFTELLNWLASQNFDITTIPDYALVSFGSLVEYLKSIGYQILYRQMNVPIGIVNVGAVDATTTTDIAIRGVTDLVVAEGASSMTSGKRTFSMLAKRIVAGAVVAAIGVSMFVEQIGSAFARIDEALEPYTIDGENVPVLIDENGKTYLEKEVIEAVRNELIDMGAFRVTGELLDGSYKINSDTYNNIASRLWTSLQFKKGIRGATLLYTRNVGNTPRVVVYKQAILTYKNGDTLDVTDDIYYTLYSAEHGNYFSYLYETDVGDTISGIRFYYEDYKASDGTELIDTNWWSGWPFSSPPKYTITHEGITKEIYGYGYNWSGYYSQSTSSIPHYPVIQNSSYGAASIIATWRAFGLEGGGVDGLVPTDISVGDESQTIDDIFPDWETNGLTMPSPTENDLTNTTPYYPISINNVNPTTQDTIASDTDQDGESSDSAKDKIIENQMNIIQELLQQLTQTETDTDTPVITPTITVEDTGDTPPAIPTLVSGASNGLWTIYNPTLSEVQQFGGWLWSENLIDQIIRQFNNPIEAVIGFMTLYATPVTGDRKIIKAGYLNSPVSAKEVTNQYITIDCGTVEVSEYYHTAIDYTQTKVEVYLPFIGIVPLDCSVVMGSTLQIIYRIDVLTGTCLAQIKVIKRNSDAVMYAYNGNCAVQLPLTASTYTGIVGVLTGLGQAVFSTVTGNTGGIVSGAIQAGSSAVNNLTGVAKSGTLSANAGALGIRIPYLIITHPTSYEAMVYNQMYGYPSNEYQRLSAMSGFVRVKDIHLHDITCTEQELDMIYDKLHTGIIIS